MLIVVCWWQRRRLSFRSHCRRVQFLLHLSLPPIAVVWSHPPNPFAPSVCWLMCREENKIIDASVVSRVVACCPRCHTSTLSPPLSRWHHCPSCRPRRAGLVALVVMASSPSSLWCCCYPLIGLGLLAPLISWSLIQAPDVIIITAFGIDIVVLGLTRWNSWSPTINCYSLAWLLLVTL